MNGGEYETNHEPDKELAERYHFDRWHLDCQGYLTKGEEPSERPDTDDGWK